MALASGAGAQSADEPELRGYTCCNFHYEGDWISDANWSSMPMIPAGARVRTVSYFGYRIWVEIEGRKMRLSLDYGRRQRMGEWARKMIVAQDPRPMIEGWPAPVRDAVRAGKVAIGMTREQVIVAVGYPPMHQTPSLDSPAWKYWHTGFGTYLVVWDATGRVKEVLADPQTLYGVLAADPSRPVAVPLPARVPGRESPAGGGAETAVKAALPRPGAAWEYSYARRGVSSQQLDYSVRTIRVDGTTIEETLAVSGQPGKIEALSADQAAFRLVALPRADSLVEFSPYLLSTAAIGDGSPPPEVSGYPTGELPQSTWKYDVRNLGWENVVTPAGPYRALQIQISGNRAGYSVGPLASNTGRFTYRIWYAPDVARYVKIHHQTWSMTRQPFGSVTVELVKYTSP